MRNIPIALQDHYDTRVTTCCRLLRIKPRTGPQIGFCSTNIGLTYDAGDGAGPIEYRMDSGFDPSAYVSTGDTAVDNGEALLLLKPGMSINEVQVLGGLLDGAEFWIYEVNYRDLTPGNHVEIAYGLLGRPRVGAKGRTVALELRQLLDALRQEPWEKWQIRCRVRQFGSQPGEERFPCRYDATGEWVEDVEVTSVGLEVGRTFTASALAQAANYFAPGILEWVSGDNAGFRFAIEEFQAGGTISQLILALYPVQEGDSFRLRRDCTRNWAGHNSCETFGNRLNYRGEPKIRPAEAVKARAPGAEITLPIMGGISIPLEGE